MGETEPKSITARTIATAAAWKELRTHYFEDIADDIYKAIKKAMLTDKKWNELEVD